MITATTTHLDNQTANSTLFERILIRHSRRPFWWSSLMCFAHCPLVFSFSLPFFFSFFYAQISVRRCITVLIANNKRLPDWLDKWLCDSNWMYVSFFLILFFSFFVFLFFFFLFCVCFERRSLVRYSFFFQCQIEVEKFDFSIAKKNDSIIINLFVIFNEYFSILSEMEMSLDINRIITFSTLTSNEHSNKSNPMVEDQLENHRLFLDKLCLFHGLSMKIRKRRSFVDVLSFYLQNKDELVAKARHLLLNIQLRVGLFQR